MDAPSGISETLTAFLGHSGMPVNGTELVERLVMLKSKFCKSVALVALLSSTSIPPVAAQETTATGDAPTTEGAAVPTVGIVQINQALDAITTELMKSLPPTGTYAIKSANDTTAGVPEDLLVQMTSSLQSSLMVASDFQMTLIDQAQLKNAWSNAVEFNGADFEKLVENANFDALIILHTRATESGVEMSLQAVGATAKNSGNVIASTKIEAVRLNWKETVGLDVAGVNDEIIQIRRRLQELQSLNEPILAPSNWIDLYSNAKIYSKQRNIDAALGSLEKALLAKPDFFDLALEFSNMVRARYGATNAAKYFTTRLAGKIKTEHDSVIRLALGINDRPIENMRSDFEKNPVLAAVWFWSDGQTLLARRNADFSKSVMTKSIYDSYDLDYHLLTAVRAIIKSDMDGSLANSFFDVTLQEDIIKMPALLGIEEQLNRVEYRISSIDQTFGRGDAGFEFDSSSSLPANATNSQPAKSKLVDLKPLNIMGRPWYSIDWRGYQKVMDSYGYYGGAGICGLETCGLDILINGYSTLPSCKDMEVLTPGQTAALFWSIFDADTGNLRMTDFETEQSRALDIDVGRLYTSTAPLIPPRYADFCIVADAVSGYNFLEKSQDGSFQISAPSDLLITDDVDTTKPVLLTFSTPWGMEDAIQITVDITKDGTSIYRSGFPLKVRRYQDHEAGGSQFVNGWLYVPGWIESALFSESLESVSYTDKFGRSKKLDNIFLDRNSSHTPTTQTVSIDRLENFSYRWRHYGIDEKKQFENYVSPAQEFEALVSSAGEDQVTETEAETSPAGQVTWSDLKDIGTCFPSEGLVYVPTNISEYVNLRFDPSTQSAAISKIEKGEPLSRADGSTYFGLNSTSSNQCYRLCDSENNGKHLDKTALGACIEDNGLWYKMRNQRGQVGYISAKFLAVQASGGGGE